MAELTNLICPTCGGKIDHVEITGEVTCQFCGNKYLISHKDGEISQFSFDKERINAKIQSIREELNELLQNKSIDGEKWYLAKDYKEHPREYKNTIRGAKIMLFGGVGLFAIDFIIIGISGENSSASTFLACVLVISIISVFLGILAWFSGGVQRKNQIKQEKQYNDLAPVFLSLDQQIADKKTDLEKYGKYIGLSADEILKPSQNEMPPTPMQEQIVRPTPKPKPTYSFQSKKPITYITRSVTYKSEREMNRDMKSMQRKGWEIVDFQVVNEGRSLAGIVAFGIFSRPRIRHIVLYRKAK